MEATDAKSFSYVIFQPGSMVTGIGLSLNHKDWSNDDSRSTPTLKKKVIIERMVNKSRKKAAISFGKPSMTILSTLGCRNASVRNVLRVLP